MQQNTIWITQTIGHWSAQKIKLATGVSTGTLENSEKYIGFVFPQSFKELYKVANGFKNWEYNEHFFSVWPIEKIIEEFNYNRHPDFVGFCDFMINSHWIGFMKGQEGIFKRWDTPKYPPEKIADNFEDAIGMINSDDESIY